MPHMHCKNAFILIYKNIHTARLRLMMFHLEQMKVMETQDPTKTVLHITPFGRTSNTGAVQCITTAEHSVISLSPLSLSPSLPPSLPPSLSSSLPPSLPPSLSPSLHPSPNPLSHVPVLSNSIHIQLAGWALTV